MMFSYEYYTTAQGGPVKPDDERDGDTQYACPDHQQVCRTDDIHDRFDQDPAGNRTDQPGAAHQRKQTLAFAGIEYIVGKP